MLIKEKTNPTARLCRNRERGRNCKGRVHSRARIAAGLLSLVKFTAAPGCCMLGTSDHASMSHSGGPCLRVTRWWTMPPCHTVGKRKPECDLCPSLCKFAQCFGNRHSSDKQPTRLDPCADIQDLEEAAWRSTFYSTSPAMICRRVWPLARLVCTVGTVDHRSTTLAQAQVATRQENHDRLIV